MFGLFAPRCPLNLGLKVWTERRFRDIGEELGASHIRGVTVVEPDTEIVPHSDEPDELIQAMFERVCGWMEVSPQSLRLRVTSGLDMADLLAVQSHGRIQAAKSLYRIPSSEDERAELIISTQIDLEPARLLAIIARGVAHDVLRTRVPDLFEAEDRLSTIDLVPAFFGLGIFVANSTVREVHGEHGTYSTFQLSRAGHLSAEVHSYALALFAWARGEQMSDWTRRLRLDARETMKGGLRFLTKTGDCIFEADSFGHRSRLDSLSDLRRALAEDSPTLQMNALLNLENRPDDCRQLTREMISLLKTRDRDQRAQTVQTLAVCIGESEDALEAILNLYDDPAVPVRFAVAQVLRPGSADDESCIRTLTALLPDREPGVCVQAASRLLEFESLPEELLRPAIDLLCQGNIRCDGSMMRRALQLLDRLSSDVPTLLQAELDEESQAAITDLAEEVLGSVSTSVSDGSASPEESSGDGATSQPEA